MEVVRLASNLVGTINFNNPVQDLLLKVEEKMRSQADQHHPDLAIALHHLLSSGGKRIRPAFTLLCGGMMKSDRESLVTLAAAIELLHTATLVHDDLIDGSLLRRGIATLNSQWSPAATVLTGDFIFARAAKLASETNSVAVMHIFADTLATIVNGEITQLFDGHGIASRENYLKRIYAKTASMFELAAIASAILSPFEKRFIDQIQSFGKNIGMAFQIVDDVIDFIGDETKVGKPIGSDLRQGLLTLPVFYYIEQKPSNFDFEGIILNGLESDEKITELVGLVRESGAIEKSMEEARRYIQNSLIVLDHLPSGIENDSLHELALYIVDRKI